ncbi:MAG TPA: hypothetical protein PLC98_08005 [Anaerolineales bacterium]|nr:hypothetical protein [Anaerolineales bacterium]
MSTDKYTYINGERIRQLTDKELLEENTRLSRPVSDGLREKVEAQEKLERDLAKLRADAEKYAADRQATQDKRRAEQEAAEHETRREAMRLRLEPYRLAERQAWVDAGGSGLDFDAKVWPDRATSHALRIAAEDEAVTQAAISRAYRAKF